MHKSETTIEALYATLATTWTEALDRYDLDPCVLQQLGRRLQDIDEAFGQYLFDLSAGRSTPDELRRLIDRAAVELAWVRSTGSLPHPASTTPLGTPIPRAL